MPHFRSPCRLAAVLLAVLLGGLALAPAASASTADAAGARSRVVAAPMDPNPCDLLFDDAIKKCKEGDKSTQQKQQQKQDDPCDLLKDKAKKLCEERGQKADDPCDSLDPYGKKYCQGETPGDSGDALGGSPGAGITDGASGQVQKLADTLITQLEGLVAPDKGWAPEKPDNWLYGQFLWLGQHLAVAIFICIVVVCGLTAWQGAPRLRQMGASTGWTLAAVAGMASIPGAVMLLNKAVSGAFEAAFNSSESTLFTAISSDMGDAADSGNPLAVLIIISALVVALAFAALVFMARNLGIVAFVCMAPLVLASLARGGDTSAVKTWAMRLLGLMFTPFALLLVTPFVKLAQGSLVVDAMLLVAADALMLRMIFHGIPYFGPRIAGAARAAVERRTDNPLARAVVRAGAPTVYEQENTPRGPRIVDTPGRAMAGDRGVLFAAYGINRPQRPGRLTTASAVASATREETERAARARQITQARRQARAAAQPPNPSPAPRPGPGTGPPSNS